MAEEEEKVEGLEEVEGLEMSRSIEPDYKLPLDEVREHKIYDDFGNGYWFSDLHKKKKAIIIFIRHFLCFAAKEYIDDLALVPDNYLKESNVRLVVIGCGPWKFIQSFREATGYAGLLFTDPTLELHKKLGLHPRVQMGTMAPSKHIKSGFFTGTLKSIVRGFTTHEFQGDVGQQGGAIILGPGDDITYLHRDERTTDHAAINDLLCMAGVQQVNFPGDRRVMSI